MTRDASTRRRAADAAPKATAGSDNTPLLAVARQLRNWTDTVLGLAGPATDLALGLARAGLKDPKHKAVVSQAGSLLRRMRDAAGLSIAEVAQALDLSDPTLIEQAEGGQIALPFELILRLAAVLGRGDPVTAVMKLTRAYNPALWKALEDLGVGRLVVQAGRERELANIYRASDAARRLSDEDFAQVLAFTKTAFETALAFRAASAGPRPKPAGVTKSGRARSQG